MGITVIIPTICKPSKDILDFTLKQLNCNKSVVKVIIIDNIGKFREKYKVTDKIDVVNKGDLKVNPAWNYGVSITDTEYYLLLNDDVFVDSSVIEQTEYLLDNNKDYNVLFVDTKNESEAEYIINVPRQKRVVNFVNCKNMPMVSLSGCFIFGRKNSWVDIPKELQIFFGDNWILAHNRDKAGKVLTTYVSHKEAVTAKDYYNTDIMNKEKQLYEKAVECLN